MPKKRGLSAPRIIILGFLCLIAAVTALLSLPVSAAGNNHTPFIDALFTAVSAVCVTGLISVHTGAHWSPFGHVVIVVAAQVGALGLMTFITFFLALSGKRITLKERILLGQTLNRPELAGMVRTVKRVVAVTFIVEGFAALILAARFIAVEGVSVLRGLWYGVFHSICAFCSAGFEILTENGISKYISDPVTNITLMALVVLGGLGYAVWIDAAAAVKNKRRNKSFLNSLNLHSYIVVVMTLALTVSGTAFILLSEWNNPGTLGVLNVPQKLLAAAFQSVTPRTLGYGLINQQNLRYSSKLLTMLFMAVGGSPGSTAGGIKTVTLAVIGAAVISVIRGRDSIVLRKRQIAFETLQKALAVVCVYLFIVITATMLLTFTERNAPYAYEFFDLLFEACSAVGTVGLSLGITQNLSAGGKAVIAACMLLGRIGGITVAISLSSGGKKSNALHYPEGRLIVG